jgi:hypothetical protein
MFVGEEGAEAEPAKLVLAPPTVHVLTAPILLDHDSALGAWLLEE